MEKTTDKHHTSFLQCPCVHWWMEKGSERLCWWPVHCSPTLHCSPCRITEWMSELWRRCPLFLTYLGRSWCVKLLVDFTILEVPGSGPCSCYMLSLTAYAVIGWRSLLVLASISPVSVFKRSFIQPKPPSPRRSTSWCHPDRKILSITTLKDLWCCQSGSLLSDYDSSSSVSEHQIPDSLWSYYSLEQCAAVKLKLGEPVRPHQSTSTVPSSVSNMLQHLSFI